MTPERRAKIEAAIDLIDQADAIHRPAAEDATRNALIGMGARFDFTGSINTLRLGGVMGSCTSHKGGPLFASWHRAAHRALAKQRNPAMTDEQIERLEAELRGLLHGEYSSLSIGFNDDHAPNYEKASEWRDYRDPEDRIDWVSKEEREKALVENSVWTCQWYPNGPVGFNCIGASSLSALLAALRAIGEGEG